MKLAFAIVLITLSFSGFTQTTPNWISTYSEAQEISSKTGKPMLIFFSGSDWCKPCIKLKKYIIETEEFTQYADKFVLYNADFPYRVKQEKELKEQNEKLAEQYNNQGSFPKVVIIDKAGKVMCSTGYVDCTPHVYIEKMEIQLNK